MRRPSIAVPATLGAACIAVALFPLWSRSREATRLVADLARRANAPATPASVRNLAVGEQPDRLQDAVGDPTLFVRVGERANTSDGALASWQTIGGCGAGAGAGSSAGLKWIGRNVSGGLFNVQEQVSYSDLGKKPYSEHNFFVNTLINSDVSEKWNVAVLVPFVYKWFDDPKHLAPLSPAVDYSNAGLGDISLMATRRLGAINNTLLTAVVGLPTGKWDATWPSGAYLSQAQQVGFGRPSGTLVLDHVMDQVWGLVIVGGAASYRGGRNKLDSYRAPTAAGYAYAGYFLGPLVPAFGLTLSGFPRHDIDLNSEQFTPLASLAASVSLEWSTDWIALLAGASIPYKYDGIRKDEMGLPRSPWGFMPWTVAIGASIAPF
jgi:hypothetical protein